MDGEQHQRRVVGLGHGAQTGVVVVENAEDGREKGYRSFRDGKGIQVAEKTLRKGMGSWWRDGHI